MIKPFPPPSGVAMHSDCMSRRPPPTTAAFFETTIMTLSASSGDQSVVQRQFHGSSPQGGPFYPQKPMLALLCLEPDKPVPQTNSSLFHAFSDFKIVIDWLDLPISNHLFFINKKSFWCPACCGLYYLEKMSQVSTHFGISSCVSFYAVPYLLPRHSPLPRPPPPTPLRFSHRILHLL